MTGLRCTRGMILLTTILMLSLLAALVFSMQQAVWVYTRLHLKTCMTHRAFEALEQEVFKLIRQIDSTKKNCLSTALDVNDAVRQLKAERGCIVTTDKIKYRYWVNVLDYPERNRVLAVHAVLHPEVILSVRLSKTKVPMSWYMIA
ncbi:MAG: hypothetical protein P1U61_06025 [Legionellaceae bacterium]|nr:hypothetical protein [Legionellaceae bacterium]